MPCQLTPAEMLQRGLALAQLEEKIVSEDQHADSVEKELKAREAQLVLERSKLALAVRTGREPREVDCHAVLDFGDGRYDEFRDDTGEVIFSRPLTDAERQQSLLPESN